MPVMEITTIGAEFSPLTSPQREFGGLGPEVHTHRLPGLRLAAGQEPRHILSLLFPGLASLPVRWRA